MGITLEKQLQILSECGVKLLPDRTVEHLLASDEREAYENEPYLHLLIVMGGELEVEPFGLFTENIWHFDTECVEDHGSYAKIAQRMKDLAGAALPLEDISDYVNIEEEEVWLSFKLNGEKIRWEAEVSDDWVDPKILSRFALLLDGQVTMANRFADFLFLPSDRKRFTYLDLKGQDCLLGCSTTAQLRKLRKTTGLDFQWLS